MENQKQERPDRFERMSTMVAMREAGRSVRDIAAEFGLSSCRVYRILASAGPLNEGEQKARQRFPGLHPKLAMRLDQRFPDDDTLRRADDADLLSMRHMSPTQLAALRQRFPRDEREAVDRPPLNHGRQTATNAR